MMMLVFAGLVMIVRVTVMIVHAFVEPGWLGIAILKCL
ncbi:MAG: hypothetical protein ACJAY3_000672 [Neolewinella sp.]|jgi:hypothetical protein